MGQRLSLIIGVINGTNVNSYSKIFDSDGLGELYNNLYCITYNITYIVFEKNYLKKNYCI